MLSFQLGVTVWLPIPVFADALNSFVAVGAVEAAGNVYGYPIALVAKVHVAPASQLLVGAAVTVVAEVDSVLEPVVKVVDVAVTFQPVPDPVASPTSFPCVEVIVWSDPFKVALKLTFGGVETNARLPALIVAVPLVAPAGRPLAKATDATAAANTHSRCRGKQRRHPACLIIAWPPKVNPRFVGTDL